MTNFVTLSPKKRRAIEVLLSSGDLAEVERAAGVSRETLYRWLRQPDFKGALDLATSEALTNLSRDLVCLGSLAVQTLRQTMQNAEVPAGVKVRAAAETLVHITRLREFTDLEQRLLVLEAAYAQKGAVK